LTAKRYSVRKVFLFGGGIFSQNSGSLGQLDVGALQGRRDAHLRELLVDTMQAEEPENHTIINPAAVFGRHPRWLAERLPTFSIIAGGR
jgi:hypothetical protein